jgi:hypothetical protein
MVEPRPSRQSAAWHSRALFDLAALSGRPGRVRADLEQMANPVGHPAPPKAGAQGGTRVVLHFEPDLWGFMQQRAAGRGAASIPAQVAATGVPELAGLPNDLTGFARAATVLRDRYASNVWVIYQVSLWGTGTDITITDPPDAQVDALADTFRNAATTRTGTPRRSPDGGRAELQIDSAPRSLR